MVQEQTGEIQNRRGLTDVLVLALKSIGPAARECRKPLETENNPQPQVRKDTGPSVLEFSGNEFCNNQNEHILSPGLPEPQFSFLRTWKQPKPNGK